MELKEVVAHVRADLETKYGERLENVEIIIAHTIDYPCDLAGLLLTPRPRHTRAQLREAVETGKPLPPLPDPPSEPAQPELPLPHAIYTMQVQIRAKSRNLGGSRKLVIYPIIALTPERLFERWISECESKEAQAAAFPIDLL